jgi:hypothetical protein
VSDNRCGACGYTLRDGPDAIFKLSVYNPRLRRKVIVVRCGACRGELTGPGWGSPAIVEASCSECGKVSTPDAMWALYCLDCAEKIHVPAEAGPRAFNPDGEGSTPSGHAK